jgi:hypothetical protein
VLYEGVRVVIEFGPRDDGREGDVHGAACVGADEELDPEGERVGVHWERRDGDSLAQLAPFVYPGLVSVAGRGREGTLHDAAAVDGEGGSVEEADVLRFGVVEMGGAKESDSSAVYVERR